MTMDKDAFDKFIAESSGDSTFGLGHLSSWSTGDDALKRVFRSRDGDDPDSYNVVLECKSKSGVSIKDVADVDMDEVLYSKKARFKVLDTDPDYSVGKYKAVKLTLEEVGNRGDSSDLDGGPGSGNHGHEGVPGQVGGSAPSLTPAASKLLHGKSEDFKAEFLVEKGMRFREVDKAIQAGKLDELVDEKLREVAKERKRVADKAPDDSKVRKSAEKASLEIRNNADETLVSYDEDGNEIARDTGSAHGVKSGQNNAAYSTLHNHPGDTDSCFSDTDVRSFANADEQVMYMTSKTKLYSLQKTSDYDGYSARSVATHLESLEKKYQDGDMTRNDLIAETDLYLQLHAHECGLVYKQQEVDGK